MLKKVFWKDIREDLVKICPDFVPIIDELSPNDDHYFYSIDYPFGSVIVDHGVFQLPADGGGMVSVTDPTISQKIQDDLSYSGTIPFGIITRNSIEAFMYGNERIIPSSLIKEGQFISLWRVLDKGPSYHTGRFWNITSGARSICMAPKITDTKSHKKLKTMFDLKNNVPETLFSHWDLFVNIANHADFIQPWQARIIFFPAQWFKHEEDPLWSNFYRYLLNAVWQKSSFRRNQFIFDFAFSIFQETKGLRPNPYLADIVRHLIAIGSGAVPGFTPAIDNSAAPITGFQKIYLEVYDLKKYAPVIMHAHHFSPNNSQTAYYSFQIPTTTIFSPRSRKISSTMNDLQETCYILRTLLTEILQGNLQVENTPLFNLAETIGYEFYHSDKDKIGVISSASEIAKADPNFTPVFLTQNNYSFPEFSPFFKGCVSIATKSNINYE